MRLRPWTPERPERRPEREAGSRRDSHDQRASSLLRWHRTEHTDGQEAGCRDRQRAGDEPGRHEISRRVLVSVAALRADRAQHVAGGVETFSVTTPTKRVPSRAPSRSGEGSQIETASNPLEHPATLSRVDHHVQSGLVDTPFPVASRVAVGCSSAPRGHHVSSISSSRRRLHFELDLEVDLVGNRILMCIPPRSNSMSLWRESMSARLRSRAATSSRPRRSFCSISKCPSSPSFVDGRVVGGSRPEARRAGAGGARDPRATLQRVRRQDAGARSARAAPGGGW